DGASGPGGGLPAGAADQHDVYHVLLAPGGHGDLRRPAELAHHRPAEKDQAVSFYLRPTERRGQGSAGPWARRFCLAPPFPNFGENYPPRVVRRCATKGRIRPIVWS